jgi:hypothetical protein
MASRYDRDKRFVYKILKGSVGVNYEDMEIVDEDEYLDLLGLAAGLLDLGKSGIGDILDWELMRILRMLRRYEFKMYNKK